MDLFKSELWQRLLPYAHLVGDEPKTQSVEFRNVPAALRQEALTAQLPCAYCQTPTSPFRERKHDALRTDPNAFPAGSLYLTVSCRGRSCYQSKAATELKKYVRTTVAPEITL